MILSAALKVFARSGYEATDVDDIAREAQIGKGTIYRHYPSKRDLFVAVVDRGFDQLRCQMENPRDKDASFEEMVRIGIKQHVDFFINNPDYWRILMLEKPDCRLNLDREAVRLHQRFGLGLVEGIKKGISAGYVKKIDPVLAAFSLMSMAAVVVEKHLQAKKDTRKKDISSILDIFLRGIQK